MLSQWGAGHRPARSCDSVELQPYLPPKPAGRETTGPKGTDPPALCLSLLLSFSSFFSQTLSAGLLSELSLSVPVLSACNRMAAQTLSTRILIFYCVPVLCVLGGLNFLKYISVGERNRRGYDND